MGTIAIEIDKDKLRDCACIDGSGMIDPIVDKLTAYLARHP
jgi:hypothetical protein